MRSNKKGKAFFTFPFIVATFSRQCQIGTMEKQKQAFANIAPSCKPPCRRGDRFVCIVSDNILPLPLSGLIEQTTTATIAGCASPLRHFILPNAKRNDCAAKGEKEKGLPFANH